MGKAVVLITIGQGSGTGMECVLLLLSPVANPLGWCSRGCAGLRGARYTAVEGVEQRGALCSAVRRRTGCTTTEALQEIFYSAGI